MIYDKIFLTTNYLICDKIKQKYLNNNDFLLFTDS